MPIDEGLYMLERIQAGLQECSFKNRTLISPHGGDLEIMTQIKRLCLDAWDEGFSEGRKEED
jgi:hypothetical protein